MRFALLTHEPFYPPSGGGSAEALYLAREFVRRGHELHVFSPPAADSAAVERDFGVRLHGFTRWEMGRYTRWRNLKYLLFPAFLARMVAEAAKRVPFDAILAQHAIASVAAGRLKRRLGVPVVMNFLDHLTAFMETWPAWLMPPPVLAALKRYELSLPARCDADGVLAVSDPLMDRLVAAGYPRERIRPIYYGYDAELFRFDESLARARPDSPPVVVMHGSFDHHHLGPNALGAMIRVESERPDSVFRFVGRQTPALSRLLARLKARGSRLRVECSGFVPYRDVAGRLTSATVGMVPYEESTGVHCAFVAKAVEYLGLGLPQVCTRLEGLRCHFAEEPAIRFTDFSGDALGAAILEWLKVPREQRLTWGRSASDRVRRELDWPIIARRAVDLVEEVAARHQTARR
ncbi:MAG: glycosyltransferase family 4 protein [Verrucomicrobia bacterium]|nr:glycosyltransferase family 4 protein [Verrucomicrobiota bacterium]